MLGQGTVRGGRLRWTVYALFEGPVWRLLPSHQIAVRVYGV
jgi:hypothetical protein